MVTVDDATYVKMKDALYGGDAGAASKAKAQIESNYTQQQYDNLVSKLGNMGTTQQPTAPKPSNMDAGSSTIQQTTSMDTQTPVKQQEMAGNTAGEIQQQGELKPLSQEYYNQTSQEAQDKIVKNLNDYKLSNPEYFTDYESFKRNFSYDARDDIQKNTLDEWYKGYQQGLEFSTTPVNDLYNQYNSGQLSATQLQSLRVTDPTKYAELQAQINKGNIIAAYDDDKGDATNMSFQDMAYQMMQKTFMQFMNGGSDSGATQFFAEYKDRMNSPEMVKLSDESAELQEQIENVQSDIANMKKAVEKEYEGTGATRSKINAIIADRTYELQTQLQTLDSQYKRVATQYNNRMQQYSNDFELQLQEYQLGLQERNQKMDELGFAMDLMSFETPQQQQERQWNYWVMQQEYENGNINSKDYDTRYKAALKSVQNLLSQYEGIPMQRSAEQMAQDILKAIDGGSDLGTELTKINQQIQGKKEYKMLYNQTYRNPDAGFTESFTVGDTQYVKYNGQRYTADELNSKMGNGAIGNPKPYDAVSEEMFSVDPSKGGLGAFLMDSKNANGKKGGQCAKFVNDYLQQIGVGRYFGEEDIKTRESRCNSDTPKVGTIAVFDYGVISKKTGKNHGHVAIVTQVNSDGSFVVKESNYPSGETIGTRTVQPGSTSLKGFFDPSKGASNVGEMETQNNEGVGTVGYNESRVGLYDRYINDGIAPSDQKLKGLGNGDIDKGWQIFDAEVEDYMNKTGAGTLDKKKNDEIIKARTQLHQEQAYKDYRSMQSSYTKIESSANKKTPQGDMSLIFAYMKMLDPNSVVREGEYATAQNAGNVGDKIINLYNNTITGEKLTENQRQEFLEMAKSLMDGATYNYNNLLDDYASQLFYGGDASKLGTKGTYVTQEYINKFGGETPQTTKQVNALDVVKSSLSKMSKNIQQSTPSTKATLQSKYGINN